MERQYVLDFSSARNELLVAIARLRSMRVIVGDEHLSRGRISGVVELLQRLVLLSRSPSDAGELTVEAQVMAIAARIEGRRTVSEKTVRNWRRDAVGLGLLSVEYVSQQYGGRSWNRYSIDAEAIRGLRIGGKLHVEFRCLRMGDDAESVGRSLRKSDAAQPPDEGHLRIDDPREDGPSSQDAGGGNGRKRPVMVTAPRAEMVTAPNNVMKEDGMIFSGSGSGSREPPAGVIEVPPEWIDEIPAIAEAATRMVQPASNVSNEMILAPWRVLRLRHLRDDTSLRRWFASQLALPRPILRGTEAELFFVLSAARHAVGAKREIRNRAAYFVTLVSRRKFGVVRHHLTNVFRQAERREDFRLIRTSPSSHGKES